MKYLDTIFIPLLFPRIIAHIHAVVLIYIPKCSTFNILSNGMLYLPYMLLLTNCKLKCLHSPAMQNTSQHKMLMG